MPAAFWCLWSQDIFFRTKYSPDLRDNEGHFFLSLFWQSTVLLMLVGVEGTHGFLGAGEGHVQKPLLSHSGPVQQRLVTKSEWQKFSSIQARTPILPTPVFSTTLDPPG